MRQTEISLTLASAILDFPHFFAINIESKSLEFGERRGLSGKYEIATKIVLQKIAPLQDWLCNGFNLLDLYSHWYLCTCGRLFISREKISYYTGKLVVIIIFQRPETTPHQITMRLVCHPNFCTIYFWSFYILVLLHYKQSTRGPENNT